MVQPIGILLDYSIIHISTMNRHVIQYLIGALDFPTLISRTESCGKNLLANVDKHLSKNKQRHCFNKSSKITEAPMKNQLSKEKKSLRLLKTNIAKTTNIFIERQREVNNN